MSKQRRQSLAICSTRMTEPLALWHRIWCGTGGRFLSSAFKTVVCHIPVLLESKVLQNVLIIVCLLAFSPLANSYEVSVNRFDGEIANFELADQAHAPAPGGTLFVGSSTFTKWTDLEKTFQQFHAINRGFGGATIPEIEHYFSRIITPYKPSRVVFYAGTNDIGDGHSAERVYQDFVAFAKELQTALPNTELYFISMSMPPCRTQFAHEYEGGNRLILAYCEKTPHLHYIDVTPVMRDADGKLNQALFRIDRLHMTQQGYDAWTPLLTKALQQPLNTTSK